MALGLSNSVPLQFRDTREIAIRINERRRIQERGCGNPIVVFAKTASRFRQLSIEPPRLVRHGFRHRQFSKTIQKESNGLFVTTTCKFTNTHGRTCERLRFVLTQETAHRTHAARRELFFEVDQRTRIKEQHADLSMNVVAFADRA